MKTNHDIAVELVQNGNIVEAKEFLKGLGLSELQTDKFIESKTATSPAEPVKNSAPAVDVLARYRAAAHAAIARGEKRILPIVVGGKNPAITWKSSDLDLTPTNEWTDAKAYEWVELAGQEAIKAKGEQEFNACVVAKPDEFVFIDCDTYREFVAGYEAFAGEKFPLTYTTSARDNRTQIHFRQTDATRTLGNVVQFEAGNINLSIRQRNEYVIAENSIHMKTGTQYVAVVDAPIVPMPDKMVEYVRQLKSLVVKQAKDSGATYDTPRNERGLVPHGAIHGYLLREAGKLRAQGLGEESIRTALYELVEKNCQPPIDWSRVDAMAKSICTFPEGQNKALIMSSQLETPNTAQVAQPVPANLPIIDTSEAAVRPVFPLWAIRGTSIYEGLVEPACTTSSKLEEFLFMPAMQMAMNYLAGKVRIELNPVNMNLFVGLVSPYGDFFKSTSCSLAHQYFQLALVCAEASGSIKNADSRVMIAQAGSPEGFGKVIFRMNGKHALLFNDELGKFVSKAGIEGSGFASDILSWYGAGSFGNNVKSTKDSFLFEAGTYTFGWLWATTDRGFNRHWPKLAGISSGLEDRMFFVVSPEKPKPVQPYSDPSGEQMVKGAKRTRELLDAAVNQGTFHFEEPEMFARRVEGLNPRSMDLVKKLALFMAVDLGLKTIDDDCVDRAVALVNYRNQAAAFLEPIEADNVEGRLQKEIIRELRQHSGKITHRDLCRNLDYARYGTTVWRKAFYGLVNEKAIFEFDESRTQGKRATKMVGLVKHDEGD